MSRCILLLLLLSTVFFISEARRKQEVLKEEEQVVEQQATVLQALHFQSETQKLYTLDIDDIIKDKPLVFLLQKANQQQTDEDLEQNPLTITISSGNEKKECTLNHLYGLCSLPKASGEKGMLKVQCKKTPCKAKWKLQQPQTIQIDGNHTLNHLVSVNEQKNHAMINVFCQDPEIRKELDDKIQMFTNSKYHKVVNDQGKVIYFFDNQQKGEYFIATGDRAIEACTVVTIKHAEDTIELSKKGMQMGDFFISQKANIYQIKNNIEEDLQINMLIHDALLEKMKNTTQIDIQFVGYDDKNPVALNHLTFDIDDEKQFQAFSLVFKKPSKKYDRYEVHMKTVADHYLIADMRFIETELHELQLSEQTFFDLKKGQKINYKIIPLDQQQKNIQTVYIGLSDSKALTSTQQSCGKTGCQFTVEAKEDVKGSIYIGEDVKKKKATEIVEQQFDKSIGAKLREGQQRFYLYKMKNNNAVQMLVNSPNVLVYVANKAVCSGQMLAKCHQKQINYHNPSIYQSKQNVDLVFMVRALDNAKFVLTVVDVHQPYIQLKDTEPFVYLLDSNEQKVIFNFKIPQKQDVSFNLIAPLKELNMMILNKEGEKYDNKDQEQGQFSSQGSIVFTKDDLKSTSFIIVVSKREEYKDKYVHFTLIASTKETNLILQPSNAHYQKLPVKASRDYVFSIYPGKKLFINFHVPNQKTPKLGFKISNAADYKDSAYTAQYTVDKQTDVLSLQTVSQRLCKGEQSECQIFARLTNEMQKDVEVTITLMIQNAIIELKDGIWQNYDLNEAASTSHFYFLPKHQKHSTTIFYHSTLVDLQIAYNLWKSDDTSLDVSTWPFPTNYAKTKTPVSNLQFKPSQFIHIGVAELQKCWPNCVILLSIIPVKKELDDLDKNPTPLFDMNHSFKIMASNNLITVPQKHKMDIVLNKEQEKFLLVNLQNYMERQTIVFFTNSIVGNTAIKANVYTQNNPRCPTMEQFGADFVFAGIETQLALEDIKKKLEQNKMSDDKNTYLCILSYAYSDSKFSFEFVPEAKEVKTLQLDTTTTVNVLASQARVFQVHASFEFYLKISRVTGFPYISKKLCDKPEEMESCFQEFVNSDSKGEQLVNKIMALSDKPCKDCMFYVKVFATETSQVSIHAQSRFVEIELKQNTPLTDTLAAGQMNKYLITGVQDKEVNINIQIISGDIKIQINDFDQTSLTKMSKKGSSNVRITIPPKQLKDTKKLILPFLSAFLFSSGFHQLHLSVQSQDSKAPASFIISYSNGDVQTYLQDGLISQFSLAPKKISKFLYNNPSNNQIYLHLSSAEAQTLNNLKVNIYSIETADDQDSKSEIKVQKQDFKKKTVNPTMLMHLPAKTHYEIEIQNQNSKEASFFIGVNNKEIIYLPLEHEFPFRLQNKQYLYFVLPVSRVGYLRFTLNKCDSSQPYISYTDSYEDFVAQTFQTQEQVSDTLIYDNVIKIKKAGSLYFKIRAEDQSESVLTVKAFFSSTKIDLRNAKAGNKGNLEYSFVDSQNAEITYSGVVCDKNCGDFTYSLIQSNNISKIIAQLVCSSVSFDMLGFTQNKQADVVPIKATTTKDNKLAFNFPVKEDINYVGVKAVSTKTGVVVYYQPLEITTIRGRINRVMQTASEPSNFSWLVGIIIIISIVVSLIAYRRYQKKKSQSYTPLSYDEMQDSMH